MASLAGILKLFSKRRPFEPSIERVGVTHGGEELKLFRQALAQSGDAVTIANAEGVITYVNPAFERITGYTADEVVGQRPFIFKSGEHDEHFYARLWAILETGNSFHGVVINRSKSGVLFHEEKTISPITNLTGCVTHYVSTGRNIDARIATERRLHYLAYYDALTDLPNRKLFLKQLKTCIESAQGGFGLVLLLDINNLKNINDTLGYRAGDKALCQIAGRLKRFCQRNGSVARLGGDEFGVIVTDCDDPKQATTVANLQELLGQPVDIEDQEVFVSANFGIVKYPQDAGNPEDLLGHADLALHRAKEAGPNTFLFYQDSMRDRLVEDMQIETALHGALERNELHLAFQPVVRSADRFIVGLEVLLRWESPTLGAISPARFIPQLERNGLIIAVGRWVLATACGEVAAMKPPGKGLLLRVAVNISARQLLHPDFVMDVKAALENSGLAADRLELEITESVLIENAGLASNVLRDLCLLGVRIAADDFGTGYSSLSYLWKFPFSTLKIDRSFVFEMIHDDQVRVIVSTILNLARCLGLEVVAEGIETEIQFEALKTMDCPLIQGYWTGRPLPLGAIKALVGEPGCRDIRHPGGDEVNGRE